PPTTGRARDRGGVRSRTVSPRARAGRGHRAPTGSGRRPRAPPDGRARASRPPGRSARPEGGRTVLPSGSSTAVPRTSGGRSVRRSGKGTRTTPSMLEGRVRSVNSRDLREKAPLLDIEPKFNILDPTVM